MTNIACFSKLYSVEGPFFYDPDKDGRLIKDSNYEDFSIYRRKRTHEPIFTLCYEDVLDDSYKVLVIKDMKGGEALLTVVFTNLFCRSYRFDSVDEALRYIEEKSINEFSFYFYRTTIKLLKKGTHPFIRESVPAFCYNGITNRIYRGISQMMLQYTNIITHNDCRTFFSTNNLTLYKSKYRSSIRGTSVITGSDGNNRSTYDMLFPQNYITSTISFDVLGSMKDAEYPSGRKDVECDEDGTKLLEIADGYFQCMKDGRKTEPGDRSFLTRYLTEKPFEFIRLMKTYGN